MYGCSRVGDLVLAMPGVGCVPFIGCSGLLENWLEKVKQISALLLNHRVETGLKPHHKNNPIIQDVTSQLQAHGVYPTTALFQFLDYRLAFKLGLAYNAMTREEAEGCMLPHAVKDINDDKQFYDVINALFMRGHCLVLPEHESIAQTTQVVKYKNYYPPGQPNDSYSNKYMNRVYEQLQFVRSMLEVNIQYHKEQK